MTEINQTRWIFPLLILLAFIFLACTQSAQFASQSDAFLTDAEANNWYITSGSGFVKLDENLDTYRLPKGAHAEAETLELLGPKNLNRMDFSPDGNFLVATATSYGEGTSVGSRFMIFDMDLNTVAERNDLLNHYPHSPYRWSPDGNYIAFGWESDVVLYDVSADTFTEIYNDFKRVEQGVVPDSTPNWSPDSKQLLIQTNSNKIAILTIATGDVSIISEGREPSWSPDGRTIVFHKGADYTPERTTIMQYDVASGELSELFLMDSSFKNPLIWTPDSQYLVFKSSYVNSFYGEMLVYSFAESEVQATGKDVATLSHSILLELPTQFEERLRLRTDYETNNPNRNPRDR